MSSLDVCNTCTGSASIPELHTPTRREHRSRHSISYIPSRNRYLNNTDREHSAKKYEPHVRCHGEDEATLRQMLLEYVNGDLMNCLNL